MGTPKPTLSRKKETGEDCKEIGRIGSHTPFSWGFPSMTPISRLFPGGLHTNPTWPFTNLAGMHVLNRHEGEM